MTIRDPFACGFAKVAVYNIMTRKHGIKKEKSEHKYKFKSRILLQQYDEYNTYFNTEINTQLAINYKSFTNTFPKIIDNVRTLSKKGSEIKEHIFNTFSTDNWKELSPKQKSKHAITKCKACLKNLTWKSVLAMFPMRNFKLQSKADKGRMSAEHILADITNQNVRKENSSKRTGEVRSLIKKAKKDIENQWQETTVERAYGVPISLTNRNKLRLTTSFEPTLEAKTRTIKEQENIKQGLKRKHSHIGKTDQYKWCKEECLKEVEGYADKSLINYSELSRRYNLQNESGTIPGNGGQILKELLIENGCNINRFHSTNNTSTDNDNSSKFTNIRRKKRKFNLPNCTDISIPLEVTNETVTEKLSEKIINGEYKLGELIVPQTFERLVLRNNNLVSEEVSVHGRKINLQEIRSDMLCKHKKYMRLRSDDEFEKLKREEIIKNLKTLGEHRNNDEIKTTEELMQKLKKYERTRNLMFWHDGSSLASHGHILMLVSIMYDQAVFLSDDEYFEKTGIRVNVQANVEKPHLYILARCPSTDQQLLYVDERIDDILKIKNNIFTEDGIEITDIVRVFKGDHPASQFESGQNKGGNYACHGCPVNSHTAKNFTHSFSCRSISLKERVDAILTSVQSKDKIKAGKVKLYSALSKGEIITELHQRGVRFTAQSNKQHLESLLEVEMHGIQRLPALMFNEPFVSLEDLNLDKYEILVNEPLHDISNHIKNIQVELPNHLDKELKVKIHDVILSSFNGKEAKNSSDYRKSLLMITNWFLQHHKHHFALKILTTLSEIQEILYLPEIDRTPVTILRLIITCFKHAMLLKIHIDGNVKSLTERKMFGIYYHSLIRHSAEQYRLFSGRTTNTEKEEAMFNPLKTYTKLTSNHQPDNVISNSIIRVQATNIINSGKENHNTNESYLHQLYKPIKEKSENHLITFDWILKYPFQYQTMLMQMADYLIDESKWWEETEDGVLFFDLKNQNQKRLTHFRSTTITENNQYVSDCWKQCLNIADQIIPACKIKIKEHGKEDKIVKLNTLKYFAETEEEKLLNEECVNTDISANKDTSINSTADNSLKLLNEECVNTSMNKDTSINSTADNSVAFRDISIDDIEPAIDFKKSFKTCIASTPITKAPRGTPSNTNIILSLKPTQVEDKLQTKTGDMLVKVLGRQQLVFSHDKNRKALKLNKNNLTLINNYKNSSSEIKTELSKEENSIKKNLKDMEMRFLMENENCSLKPNESTSTADKESYNCILNKLKYIKVLRRDLK